MCVLGRGEGEDAFVFYPGSLAEKQMAHLGSTHNFCKADPSGRLNTGMTIYVPYSSVVRHILGLQAHNIVLLS